MNGSRAIDIKLSPNAVLPEHVRKSSTDDEEDGSKSFIRRWTENVVRFAREDRNRVMFALKVGLAMLLVSLFILIGQTFQAFGINIIWAIFTVAIIFEYTVGATLNRGFNRAVGSLLAGITAIAVLELAVSSGHYAEPYIIGLSIFLVGAITSFMKLWPSFEPYEHGFRVTLFTYCLIIVSGYRMGNPIRTAVDRLYSIAIGGVVAVAVNILVFPIWAGEQLHDELVKSFHSVADSLEECVKKYLSEEGLMEQIGLSNKVMEDYSGEPAFQKCRTTLNSSARIDSLATSAKWEPPHGRFRSCSYPWSEYVKVVAVLRHCAYEVVALHGCLHSEIQAEYNLRLTFRSEILDTAVQAAELLRGLASDMGGMKQYGFLANQLKRVHGAAGRLQRSIDLHSYLLTSYNSLYNYGSASLSKDSRISPDQAPVTKKKQQKRLHSWPSREADEAEEEGPYGGAAAGELMIPRMVALESTAAMSLATFTFLLIEFVARLDRLVDAVAELATTAKFKQQDQARRKDNFWK